MNFRLSIPTMLMLMVTLGSISWLESLYTTSNKSTSQPTVLRLAGDKPVFEKLPSQVSQVHFNNRITANIETAENVFDFDYFYNGAGVGAGDLNNDGLPDLVFTGNQVENQIYRNLGNLRFEDVTETSGINLNKHWANGVTFVDINQDGWLDIYICQGGPHPAENRLNLLFVNQQNMTFVEKAAEYGLADPAISNQAVFFDYDRDGDLDCFVMNENPLYGVDPINFNKILESRPQLLHESSSHLYENQNGVYQDVSAQAGLLKPTFGLGLVVSDFNEDNWLDIYMANDYYVPDRMWINTGKKGFIDDTKQYTEQLSFFGMGVDVADINNDQLEDIFILDMASADHIRSKTLMASMNTKMFDVLVNDLDYQHQYMFNSLQLNRGNASYRNIAHMTKMAKTDWSWTVLMTDFDNDPQKDIFITNGYRKYALDNDIRTGVQMAKQVFKNEVPLDVKKRLYERMPSEKLPNLMYRNQGGLRFKESAQDWGLADSTFSNGAIYADLDQDGDLELVINNMDAEALIYKNLSKEQKRGNYLNIIPQSTLGESFAKITIHYQGKAQTHRSGRVRGYLSAVENMAHFGLGKVKKIDTLRIEWASGLVSEQYQVAANQTLEVFEKDGRNPLSYLTESRQLFQSKALNELGLYHDHKENPYDDFAKESLLPYKQSTLGPAFAQGDVNGDQKPDLWIGGATGQAGSLYVYSESGFTLQKTPAFQNDNLCEDMEGSFVDIDQDGDLDLYVVSGGNSHPQGSTLYADRLYLNDGTGQFSRASEDALLDQLYSGKTVAVLDFNQDKRPDLVVGNRMQAQRYPLAAPSRLLENTPNGLRDVTAEIIPDLAKFGIINKILPSDFNQDGWTDLLVLGEWTPIGLFENQNGRFVQVTEPAGLSQLKGWWWTIYETDVNGDQLPDYVVGNAGLNTKYKASQAYPLKVFAEDMDGNNTWDLVLSQPYKDKYVPFRGRQCSSEQMPFIAEKFPTYESFAKASIGDVYGDKLKTASCQQEVTSFASLLLINQGNGRFGTRQLPREAQISPVLSIVGKDLNQDGFEDIILAGNIYNTEVETPRWDAGLGTVLLSNQKDGYTVLPNRQSGLYLPGNVKCLTWLKLQNKTYLLATRNNDLLLSQELLPSSGK